MNTTIPNEPNDEPGRGTEHPDLVLSGAEEHPLLPWAIDAVIDDDRTT